MQNFIARPFISTTPEEQTLGVLLGWMAENVDRDVFAPVLKKHDLEAFEPTHWYSTQGILNAARDLYSDLDRMAVFVGTGRKMAEEMPFSSDVKTLPDAVMAFNSTYSQLHQIAHPEEGLLVSVRQNGSLRVVNNTPWPGELLFGILTSLADRFNAGPDARVLLTTPDLVQRTVFEVSTGVAWEEPRVAVSVYASAAIDSAAA